MDAEKKHYDFLGFGIRGYRSFTSDDMALVGPFGKVHLITGQNNSGKSSLADIAKRVLPAIQSRGMVAGERYPFTERDLPQNAQWTDGAHITLSLCFSRNSLLSKIQDKQYHYDSAKEEFQKILSNKLITHGDKDICWFDFDMPARSQISVQRDLTFNEELAEALSEELNTNFNKAALEIASSSYSNPQHNLGLIIRQLIPTR